MKTADNIKREISCYQGECLTRWTLGKTKTNYIIWLYYIIRLILCIIAQQALLFHGSWNSEHRIEETSNLHQLLLLRAGDDPITFNWLTQRTEYTSPEIQNEMLQVKL